MGDAMSPDEARFWTRVDKSRGAHACWPWLGASSGYGVFRMQGRLQPAHRLAWELTHKRRVPADLEACHSCDFKLCVNPAHVFIGTASDNHRDYAAKNRLEINCELRTAYEAELRSEPYERWLINNSALVMRITEEVTLQIAFSAPLPSIIVGGRRIYARTVGNPEGKDQIHGRCLASLPPPHNRQCRREPVRDGLCYQHYDLLERKGALSWMEE